MTEERTRAVQVGDEYHSPAGALASIGEVEIGRYGLLVEGTFQESGLDMLAYLPYELPASGRIATWYGWPIRGTCTINGQSYGYVAFRRSGPRRSFEEHEAQWERTIEAKKAEEGVMQSRPTEFRLN